MKQCPRCRKTYSDENLNFCLDDGELLSGFVQQQVFDRYSDDSPPTVMLVVARRTNPANWAAPPASAPPTQWQQQQMAPQFGAYAMPLSPNQTLAIVSLGLGIGSLTIGWCCNLGVLLAPAALITGYIALSQIKREPEKYTGRGLAIGGIVTAAVFLAGLLLFVLIYGAAILFGGIR